MQLSTIIFATFFYTAQSARILAYFWLPSISHQVVFQPIWKELSLRGHEVTVLAPSPLKDPKLKNLTEIDLNFSYEILRNQNVAENMSKDRYLLSILLFAINHQAEILIAQLESEQVQELFRDESKAFDLILVECLHPLVYGLAAKYKVPIIGASSLGVLLNSHDAIGNPTHPVLNPDFWLQFEGSMSLYDRAYSAAYNIWYRLLYNWYVLPKYDKIARKYFGKDMPYLGDLEKNVSLILVNSNPILHSIRPNVPAIIEMGQMHLNNKKKPLPKDLQTYLDKSTQGVIYFSLGSNVKSANLADKVRNVICEALAELPYNVLWKWESDHLPGKPENVMIKKWLPQQDVLAHKNIKAFVTQGGLQSMEEAINNAVPLVGMPFFADQHPNVLKQVELGIAAGPIHYMTMTKNELKELIVEVAENDKYRKRSKEIRDLLRDQPMSGLDKAVWWIEYVIRHKGAKHLRSPAADMPWYQYSLLDVYLLFGIMTGLLIYMPIKLLRRK